MIIVRNLKIENGRSYWPTRRCKKKIGPREEHLIKIMVIANTGANRIRRGMAMIKSSARCPRGGCIVETTSAGGDFVLILEISEIIK
jgi:hypothetical protein